MFLVKVFIINKNVYLKMSKSIFITESQAKRLNEDLNIKIKANFPVDPEKVKIVAKYLNSAFKRGKMNGMGEDGYPKSIPIVAMIGADGQPLKNMTDKQLFYLLQDRFSHIYDDTKKRDSLLTQIMKDWYNDKITPNGMLSVNLLS